MLEPFLVFFNQYGKGEDESFAVVVNYGLDNRGQLPIKENFVSFPKSRCLSHDLPHRDKIVLLDDLIFLLIEIICVLFILDHPVLHLDILVLGYYDVARRHTPVDNPFPVQITQALEQRVECIPYLILAVGDHMVSPFSVLELDF